MKPLRRYQFGLTFVLFLATAFVGRAASFGIGVSNSPAIGFINSNLTFSLSLSNGSGLILPDVVVLSTFPTTLQLVPGSFFTSTGAGSNSFTTILSPGQATNVTFQMLPTLAGTFTNFINITSASAALATSLTNVFQVSSGNSDLGVFISIPSTNAFPGDVAQYNIIATNAGPSVAPTFFITNTLPAGVSLIQVSPGTGVASNTPGRVVLTVNGLAVASSVTNTIFIIPTNTGPLALTAIIGAPGLTDTNTSNNSATNNLTVIAPDTNQVVATFSAQALDFQTGLFRQTVTLVNTSATAIASARLIVVGLASSNKLYNAVGTNLSHPFVIYPNAINAGDTVNFLLEFYYPSRVPQTNLTYVAYGVPLPNLGTTTNGTSIALRLVDVSASRVLVEFPSTPGKTYRIVYSTNADFSNPLMAEPPVVAPADKTQWIDEGPPKTISLPGDSTLRFYKVFQQ
ncbi:MAG: hypothetical protein JWM16_5120 [Verrucomicrobiales bacterium]|nr:hypothetical protein [Verrucomicrobiales bacterium]